MKMRFFLFFVFFKLSISFGQIEQDGSSCDKAIDISDTVQSIQLPGISGGMRWYKFKSSSSTLILKLVRSENYIIYESSSADFCSLSSKETILFAFGDNLVNADNKYIRYKAAQLSGLCACDNCLKTAVLKTVKIREGNYYYIQLMNTSYPLELRFAPKSNVRDKQQQQVNTKQKLPCQIAFMKSYTYGMILPIDSLKDNPYNAVEWMPLKYGIHVYYIKRDLQERQFKIRDYGLDEAASKCALDSIVGYLIAHPEKKIVITGFVTKGENELAEKYEQAASEALAKIVRNYLVDRKISMKRIKVEGKGSSQQLYKDEKSRVSFMYELNRNNRVEVKVFEESETK
jgi:outer membrane protein OmpA-like peptidoglycan-associated protein